MSRGIRRTEERILYCTTYWKVNCQDWKTRVRLTLISIDTLCGRSQTRGRLTTADVPQTSPGSQRPKVGNLTHIYVEKLLLRAIYSETRNEWKYGGNAPMNLQSRISYLTPVHYGVCL